MYVSASSCSVFKAVGGVCGFHRMARCHNPSQPQEFGRCFWGGGRQLVPWGSANSGEAHPGFFLDAS